MTEIDPSIISRISNAPLMDGIVKGIDNYYQMQDMADQRQMREWQMDDLKRQRTKALAMEDAAKTSVDPVTHQLNQQEYLAKVQNVDPVAAAQMSQQLQQQQMQKQQTIEALHDQMGKQATQLLQGYEQLKKSDPKAADEVYGAKIRELGLNYGRQFNQLGDTTFDAEKWKALPTDRLIKEAQTFGTQYGDYIKSRQEAKTAEATQREKEAQAKVAEEKAKVLKQGGDTLLDQDTINTMAEQYLAGDNTVFTNLGRGAQGSANIAKLRKAIQEKAKEQGLSGKDLAASTAEYQGMKAAERAVGTRQAQASMAASEANKFASLALNASNALPRGEFVPLNKVENLAREAGGDPKYSQFVAANTSLINAYARAVSPSGTPTVSDKDHAREMLHTAMTQKQYEAVVQQLQTEMKAALEAPGEVKRSLRGETDTSHPADISALLKKYGG